MLQVSIILNTFHYLFCSIESEIADSDGRKVMLTYDAHASIYRRASDHCGIKRAKLTRLPRGVALRRAEESQVLTDDNDRMGG